MAVGSWLERFKRRLQASSRARRSSRRPVAALESLEDRTLLSVTTSYALGDLTVISDGADSIWIGADASGNLQVVVNGTPVGSLPPVSASSVQTIYVRGGSADNVIDLSSIHSLVFTGLTRVRVEGGDGNDVLIGTADVPDSLFGGDGDDVLTGQAGTDWLDGGDGNDTLTGGDESSGGDTLLGGDGKDVITAGAGDDFVDAGDGDDVVDGGDGADWLDGNVGHDSIAGGTGNDTLSGGSAARGGDDTLDGGPGDDWLFGGAGDDLLIGGVGNDFAKGQGGDDTLIAVDGADTLNGGPGDDQIDARSIAILTVYDTLVAQEGNAVSGTLQYAVFTVSLSEPQTTPVQVDYSTFDITAQVGQDYLATSGTLTFAPGEVVHTVAVPIVGDTVVEGDEAFGLQLSDPVGAIVLKDQAVAVITDDDAATTGPVPNITVEDALIDPEGDPVPVPLGTFGVASAFAAGPTPMALATDDLNGDGYVDVVVADRGNQGPGGDQLSVLLNNGDGTFASPIVLTGGIDPLDVALGDFDGDGDLDVAAANLGSGDVSVFLNTGSGTFAAPQSYTVGDNANSVTAGDFDGDGDVDLAVSNLGSSTSPAWVSVLLNNGNATFSGPTRISLSGDTVQQLISADLDGDGDMDLAASLISGTLQGSLGVFLNNGDGTFASPNTYQAGTGTFGVMAADLNQDGAIDLVAVNQSDGTPNGTGEVVVFRNSGSGVFSPAQIVTLGFTPLTVSAADLDLDGDIDLAIAEQGGSNGSGDVAVLMNSGNGRFASPRFFEVGVQPMDVAAVDINNDGDVDMLTADSGADTVSVIHNLTQSRFVAAEDFITVPQGTPSDMVSADLDGDGDLDLVVAHSAGNNVSVLLNNGNGVYAPPATYAVNTGPSGLALGDVDNDGDLDLITANNGSNDASILLNNGDGTFGAATNVAVGTSPQDVFAGDLDNDGDIDLVVTNNGSNNVSILLNNGNGQFAAANNVGAGTAPTVIAGADVDGDNDIDLIIGNGGSTNNVSVMLNNGNGQFQTPTNVGIPGQPEDIFPVDIDGDGDMDLVVPVSNVSGSDQVVVLANDGTGAFTATSLSLQRENPTAVTAADLDADGNLDLAVVVSNTAGDTAQDGIVLFFGTGPGTFGAPQYLLDSSIDDPVAILAADIDGDGNIDLATANALSDSATVLLNGVTAVQIPSAVFAVQLSEPASNVVTVDYATSDGTATAGLDYLPASGTLTFLPGETRKLLVVPGLPDTTGESIETFQLNLSNALGATLIDSQATAAIVDDDSPNPPFVTVSNVSVLEGDSSTTGVQVTFTLSAASASPVVVNFSTADGTATAGEDYVTASGSVTFTPGQTTQTITVLVNGDTDVESDEVFFVNLTSATGAIVADPQALITIVTDDAIQPPSRFDIVTVLSGSFTPSQQAAIWAAEQRWEQVIVGDLPDQAVPGVGLVDDVLIVVSAEPIDGVGGVTVQSSPDLLSVRSGTLLPAFGTIVIDSADLPQIESTGMLQLTVQRAMARVLGFGTLWQQKGLLQNPASLGGTDPRFVGPLATAEYRAAFGVSESGVPVESTGGSSVIDSYWRESVLTNELMTSQLEIGVTNPLSRITVAQFADLGYEVNMAAADPYPSASRPLPPVVGGGAASVGGDSLIGEAGDDTILAGDSDDTILGGLGDDSVSAGAGSDWVFADAGDDTVWGGDGADTLYGQGGSDRLYGEGGDDLISGGGTGPDVLEGGDGNDTLVGSSSGDTLEGQNGDDALFGNAGADWLDGGSGDDYVKGQGGSGDTLIGGDGNDTLIGDARSGHDVVLNNESSDRIEFRGTSGPDAVVVYQDNGLLAISTGTSSLTVEGTAFTPVVVAARAGNDTVLINDLDSVAAVPLTVLGGSGDDQLLVAAADLGDVRLLLDGGTGNDTLVGSPSADTLLGGFGTDSLVAGDGDDVVDAGDGDDTVDGSGGADSIRGGEGGDWLLGGDGDDTVDGQAGSDTVLGGAGQDCLLGGDGNDLLGDGQGGDDTLIGGLGNDSLFGGPGNDYLDGGADNDYLKGQGGHDVVRGGEGDDTLIDSVGDDTLLGGDGHDSLQGSSGANAFNGGNGNDTVVGGSGDETLLGGDGNDLVFGSSGNDVVLGGDGDDYVKGQAGRDTLAGNLGTDTIVGSASEIDETFVLSPELLQDLDAV